MQLDSLLFNLLAFAIAQIVGLGYWRTGLPWRGIRLMMTTWVLADIALITRFALQEEGWPYLASLSAMQIYAAFELILFCSGRIRRSMPARQRGRKALIRKAFVHYLRDELDRAGKIYRRLSRSDPWDLQARVGVASWHAKQGRMRRARHCFRAARALAEREGWSDIIEAELSGR